MPAKIVRRVHSADITKDVHQAQISASGNEPTLHVRDAVLGGDHEYPTRLRPRRAVRPIAPGRDNGDPITLQQTLTDTREAGDQFERAGLKVPFP